MYSFWSPSWLPPKKGQTDLPPPSCEVAGTSPLSSRWFCQQWNTVAWLTAWSDLAQLALPGRTCQSQWQLWISLHLRPKTRQNDAKSTAHPVAQKDIQPLVNLASEVVDVILGKGSNEAAQRLFLLPRLAHVGFDHPLYVPAKAQHV